MFGGKEMENEMELITPPRDFSALIPAVTTAVESPHTKRLYARALRDFFRWYGSGPPDGFCRATVVRYREYLISLGLAPASINVYLGAVRKLASEAAANGWLDEVQAYRIAKSGGVKPRKRRIGNWLSLEEARRLLALPDRGTHIGRRDAAMLWLLLGCGLRRAEAADLTVRQLAEREGRIVLLDVKGKGDRVRMVPVPRTGYVAIHDWITQGGVTDGYVLRVIRYSPSTQKVTEERFNEVAIYARLRQYSNKLGRPIRPHDLRRTFGNLARKGGAQVSDIQRTYGHANSETTDRYLGDCMNLTCAPCDLTGLDDE